MAEPASPPTPTSTLASDQGGDSPAAQRKERRQTVDPQLVRAMGVLTGDMANFSLADTLGALPLPGDLLADMVAVERAYEEGAPSAVVVMA